MLLEGASRLGGSGDCVFVVGWCFGWPAGIRAGVCFHDSTDLGGGLAMDFDAGDSLPLGPT